MSFETPIETEDKSYYADKLKELTGRPRGYWSRISTAGLRHYLRELLKRRTRMVNIKSGKIF